MNPVHWKKIKDLFDVAREIASVIIEAETKNLEAGKCFGYYKNIRKLNLHAILRRRLL